MAAHVEGMIMTGAFGQWLPDRPSTLVIACSDGRLQEATDEFVAHHLKVTRYDRFYVPGGAGALAASGRDAEKNGPSELKSRCTGVR